MIFGFQSLTFRHGSTVRPPLPGICVVVGPNNSGKSALLRELFQTLHGNPLQYLSVAALRTSADDGELANWFNLRSRLTFDTLTQQPVRRFAIPHQVAGPGIDYAQFQAAFRSADSSGASAQIGPAFVRHLDAEGRLQTTNPAQPRDVQQLASSPIHILWDDAAFEKQLAERVRQAFGIPVSINRATQIVQLLIGEPVENLTLPPQQEVLDDLLSRPPLDSNNVGDGIRSFAGTLLHIGSKRESIYLIDEPEAFLHPPQARMLGRAIAEMTPATSQVFVSTHSAEIVEGILDGHASRDLAILRLARSVDGKKRSADLLPAGSIAGLWSDPLVRASRALDGLFTTATVVCEGDSDLRFYSAALDELARKAGADSDIHWMHVGGKARIPQIIQQLRALSIRAAAIVDFDVLNNPVLMRRLVETAGLSWDECREEWEQITAEVMTNGASATIGALKAELRELLSRANGSVVTDEEKNALTEFLRADSGWRNAKRHGIDALDEVASQAESLLRRLSAAGVFVVPVGALEGWYPNSGGKQGWTTRALENGLHTVLPPRLKRFLEGVTAWTSTG